MDKSFLNSPAGMKSLLPKNARRFRAIKQEIDDVFSVWGYSPIITPIFEYYDSLMVGMGESTKKEFYKFIDYEGDILALRPEMTAPIARTIVNRREEFSLPLRLYYDAPVYRYDSPQMGKNREIYQMGIEFIGEKSSLADAEAIIIAVEAIKKTGIEDFKIDLGHTGFLEGMIRELGLEDKEAEIKRHLNKKDFVGLKNFINTLSVSGRDVLHKLPLLRGGRDVLKRAEDLVENKKSAAAIDKLRTVYEYLDHYHLADYINFDLGLIRGLNYYTGLVFEGFTDKLGYTICGGGRYDNLIEKYGGEKIPAVGFAVGLERIRLALLKHQKEFAENTVDGMSVFPSGSRERAFRVTRRLHRKGYTVILEENGEVNEQLLNKAKKLKVNKILSFFPVGDIIEVVDVESGEKEEVQTDEGWEERIWKN
ncbi:MAG: ATP phosphoribosyltransferase regulatory subunit [Halanaerobiales bacterium]